MEMPGKCYEIHVTRENGIEIMPDAIEFNGRNFPHLPWINDVFPEMSNTNNNNKSNLEINKRMYLTVPDRNELNKAFLEKQKNLKNMRLLSNVQEAMPLSPNRIKKDRFSLKFDGFNCRAKPNKNTNTVKCIIANQRNYVNSGNELNELNVLNDVTMARWQSNDNNNNNNINKKVNKKQKKHGSKNKRVRNEVITCRNKKMKKLDNNLESNIFISPLRQRNLNNNNNNNRQILTTITSTNGINSINTITSLNAINTINTINFENDSKTNNNSNARVKNKNSNNKWHDNNFNENKLNNFEFARASKQAKVLLQPNSYKNNKIVRQLKQLTPLKFASPKRAGQNIGQIGFRKAMPRTPGASLSVGWCDVTPNRIASKQKSSNVTPLTTPLTTPLKPRMKMGLQIAIPKMYNEYDWDCGDDDDGNASDKENIGWGNSNGHGDRRHCPSLHNQEQVHEQQPLPHPLQPQQQHPMNMNMNPFYYSQVASQATNGLAVPLMPNYQQQCQQQCQQQYEQEHEQEEYHMGARMNSNDISYQSLHNMQSMHGRRRHDRRSKKQSETGSESSGFNGNELMDESHSSPLLKFNNEFFESSPFGMDSRCYPYINHHNNHDNHDNHCNNQLQCHSHYSNSHNNDNNNTNNTNNNNNKRNNKHK